MKNINQKENIFIFVADSLRYDYTPESIKSEGTLLRGLAPSLHTPVSFPSLIISKDPRNHSVRGFEDEMSPALDTLFDYFENGSFYDNEIDPIRNQVLKNTPRPKELKEIEPPFAYVERAMDTHIPYGDMGHGNELQTHRDEKSETSVEKSRDLKNDYKKGVNSVENHFWSHVETLEERGLREDTLIIFTSDHGEMLGERVNGKRRYAHVHPMARELIEVPIVFLDAEIDKKQMRLIDVSETCLQITKNQSLQSDGKDIREESVKEGTTVVNGYVSYENKWKFAEGRWEPDSYLKLKKDILREDLRILANKKIGIELFGRPGKPRNSSDIENIDL
ncbi:MAG: sulfatase-like hydrolase/transferase [Candidatus Nanohaloarchaea archaeon]